MANPDFRIAYCIICHKYTPVLKELVDRLSVSGNELYLHVDRKADIRDFAPLKGAVHFIPSRVKVYWSEYSQIESMIRLLEATRKSSCKYIVMLSGDTLPLYDAAKIRQFLENAYTRKTDFVHMQPELDIEEMLDKVERARFFQSARHRRQSRWRRCKRFFCKRLYPAKNPYFRRRDVLPPLEKGSNWMTITDHTRDYCLDYIKRHPLYRKAFRFTSCGDEIFFHTILGDSLLAANNTRETLMYTDWTGAADKGFPQIFDSEDLPRFAEIRTAQQGSECPALFIRKIDDDLDLKRYRQIVFGE